MIGIYVDTVYSLFIFLLLEDGKNVRYFLEDTFANNINRNELEKNNNIIIIKDKNKMRHGLELIEKLRNNIKIYKNLKFMKFKKFYLHDHLMYSNLFLNNIRGEIILLEDGTKNYNHKILHEEERNLANYFSIKKIVRDIVNLNIVFNKKEYRRFGLSPKILKIFLTGILPVPNQIKNKVEIINLQERWCNQTKEKQEEIINIFNINKKELATLSKDNEKILLLTQPLSEDGYISEKEKIMIYKDILKERNIKKIYVKRHPRENTDYKEIFKNEIEVVLISKKFPVELLPLLGIKFDKCITLFSTAAFFFKKYSKVEFIGTKKYTSLYDIFGEVKEI